jgi:hypothetical protein
MPPARIRCHDRWMARRCPTCRHEPYTLTGRCVVPVNADTICGCTCAAPPARGPLPTRQTRPVLDAVRAGHTWGYRIIDVTGLAETTVYRALRQLVDEGRIEVAPDRDPAAPHRVGYRPVESTARV